MTGRHVGILFGRHSLHFLLSSYINKMPCYLRTRLASVRGWTILRPAMRQRALRRTTRSVITHRLGLLIIRLAEPLV